MLDPALSDRRLRTRARQPMVVCWLLLALAGCATRSGGRTSATTDAPCLSTAGASREDREALDRLLLRLGDGEALYTLAGGIKPVSSEADLVVRVAPTVDDSALASLAALRRRAALLSCGPIGAVVQLYAATYPGRGDTLTRAASLLVYHRDRMRAAIRAHAAFFATIGVTEAAAPHDVLHAVETAPRAARWRGYGYLFGYPDDAVDFFVAAGIAGDSARTLVPRDFRRLPTVRRVAATRDAPPTLPTFVYAVARGAPPSAGDVALEAATAPVYARYVAVRARAITPDSTGALVLWRRWLSDR
jgi:hypothetical protein